MKNADSLGLKQFNNLWQKSAIALKKIEEEELTTSDNRKDLLVLSDLFNLAVTQHEHSATSGLVDWQLAMRKWRESK